MMTHAAPLPAAADRPTGLWLAGARGSVATTTVVGLLALQRGLVEPTGCATTRPPLDDVALPAWSRIHIGGHDVVSTPLETRADALADAGVLPHGVLAAVRPSLAGIDDAIKCRPDPAPGVDVQESAVRSLAADIADFRQRRGLERVVVVNVASTEPPCAEEAWHHDAGLLTQALADPGKVALPPSSATALAAIRAGCPYVNFTPSPGIRLPVLEKLVTAAGLPYAGSDGKTGQTLLRSALGPMFAARALRVRSWSGTNLLGGGDGATLAGCGAAASKLRSKSRAVTALFGDVTAPLHIDHVPDLGDVKVAWDHVAFEGFLGARMALQLSWTGYDSALAAPLVLDLCRLVAAAHAAGLAGPLTALGCFFKDPVGSNVHGFADQWRALTDWAATLPRAGRSR
jgi:myo-inositol-1-phosphate synthase